MSLYLHVAQTSFRRHLVYRTANLAGIAVNFFFTCLRVFIFTSVLGHCTEVVGYNGSQIITYMCLTEALMMTSGAVGNQDLLDAVMTGQVAMDFVRPWDLMFYWLSRIAGRAGFYAVFRGLPLFVLSWLAFRIQLPSDTVGAAWFLVSLCLGILVSGEVAFLIGLTAMWTTDARGLQGIAMAFTWFFSGLLLPPEFLPVWLQRLVYWLPFQAQIYAPTSIYLGRSSGLGRRELLVLQVLWALLLIGLGRIILAAGRRKLTVHGG